MTPSIVVALALLTGGPQGAASPAPDAVTDDRWQPWLGCWRADDDRDGRGARTCVVPADGGVRIVTLVGAEVLMTETRVADDRQRPVARDDCRGTERASWSSHGRRVYRTATVTCGLDAPRTLSSVAFMIDGPTWVDVQSLLQDGQTRVRVTRYHPAGNQQLANGQQVRPPRPGAYDGVVGPWTVEDVLEMQRALEPDAIQAAIGEGVAAFSLNRRSLTTLADAGVAERVIDLMVGLTYPERFVIKSGGGSSGAMFAGGGVDPFFAPIVGPAVLYGCYSPYAWASGYYFEYCGAMSPMLIGFGPNYYNGMYGPYNYPWVPTTEPPIAGGGGGVPAPEQSHGRVVNGHGYTQVTPANASPANGSGRWDGQSTGSSGSSGSTNGGTNGVSSGGYSGGGDGGGRMAMPRPPSD